MIPGRDSQEPDPPRLFCAKNFPSAVKKGQALRG